MKQSLFILFFTIMLGVNTQAQRNVVSGKLVYKMEVEGANAANFGDATLTVLFNPVQTRSEMVTKLGKETNVFDNKKNKGFVLKEYSGQKLMITMDADNWNERTQKLNNIPFGLGAETFQIGDYNTKAAKGVINGKEILVYYTPAYVLSNTNYINGFNQVPGLPIQFTLQSGNMFIKYTLVNFSQENIASSMFDEPHSGYRVMSYDDSRKN